jgi:4-carboxymuconolactone decarboxylase
MKTILRAGRRPEKMKDDEAIVWEFVTQLRRDHGVDDAIYARAVDKFGEDGVMDLVAVNGYYDVVSMTLNVAHVSPPKDAELPFKQAGR